MQKGKKPTVEVDGWTSIPFKKPKKGNTKWDVESLNISSSNHSRIITTFFTGISDATGAKELYWLFKEYGDIDEVIISGRRDKRGRRIDFTRFLDVDDVRKLVLKLIISS